MKGLLQRVELMDLARSASRTLASSDASFITGEELVVDGGTIL